MNYSCCDILILNNYGSFAENLEMANAEDDFDPKKVLPVEGMSKSEFQRWLMDQDSQVEIPLYLY